MDQGTLCARQWAGGNHAFEMNQLHPGPPRLASSPHTLPGSNQKDIWQV